MKQSVPTPYQVTSISELHTLLNLKKPSHPLVSIINLTDMESWAEYVEQSLAYQFYCITLRKNFDARVRYGQQRHDFDAGVMTFMAPRQVVSVAAECSVNVQGYALVVHPDFIHSDPLAWKINQFSFFAYRLQEALHLSGEEEQLITGIMERISREVSSPIDAFTQDVLIAHIGLLLNYANRFYNRQFITRKLINTNILTRLDQLLTAYFEGDQLDRLGLPSVQYVAAELNLSPNYLSDVLRAHTGLSAKQHIQHRLIDKAKEILATTSLSVGEIAYRLGFEYPQSFNKLFKSKTNVSPLEYRQSLN